MEAWRIHSRIARYYTAWSAINSTRRPRVFRRYVFNMDRELFHELQRDPVPFRTFSTDILAAWVGERSHPIGAATLRTHLPALAQRWLAERRAGTASSFDQFVRDVLRRCRTADALVTFLG